MPCAISPPTRVSREGRLTEIFHRNRPSGDAMMTVHGSARSCAPHPAGRPTLLEPAVAQSLAGGDGAGTRP